MYTIFIEYRLKETDVAAYNQAMQAVQEKLQQQEILEYKRYIATDQAGLYVEMLRLPSLEKYKTWKKMVDNELEELPWKAILPFIAGKFNMWSFEEL